MKVSDLEKKLIAVARANPPSDRVPYAFEKRMVALLAARPMLDRWALWSRALWRGAAGCLVLAILLVAGSSFIPESGNSPSDLSQDFENTMLASAPLDPDLTW